MSAILDVDEQLQLLSSFLWLEMVWDNPFIRWDPEDCEGITKISVATKNLWLPDIFIVEYMDLDKTPKGLMAYISNEGRVRYKKPMKVTSICSLDIFYFPFDQQNCTLTFSSFLYTVDHMLLGLAKDVWEMENTSQDIVQMHSEWALLGIRKASPKMVRVAIRRRPSLYVLNLLVPSGFLVAIDALSFYLPAENENRAPFKITLLLGYNVFLLMMNDLLPASGTPLISVYFALCLALMVASLLETIFITYLLHVATTQPPPVPPWLHTLLLCAPRPANCCPTLPYKPAQGPHLPPAQQPGLKEPAKPVGRGAPSPQETELRGSPGSAGTPQEDGAQKQHLVELWVQFSHLMDTLLFRLYLLFLATSLLTVIVLWST
ncbi:5-hydroxytryptamine receptor 3E-like [Erinaceus europaeus]|uniref:5-hydroxytryptamine receptor 3E-like n=1 Tax=Erinaceus europaeus TaxID=9365 RepID=A0ABM3VUM2_ERIEU|nr:5-hydroxytryptamine receptor 3E-like [Erinaceus europaeus]